MKAVSMVILLASISWSAVAQADKPKVMFVRKGTGAFDEVTASMRKELSGKYQLEDLVITRESEYEAVAGKITAAGPSLLVLMDNQALSFALRYNETRTDKKKKVRGVALMGLNLKSVLKGNPEIAGVAFESPAYTMVTQFRYLIQKPIKNVLVFYRKSLFQDTIDQATRNLAAEGVTLQAVDVEQAGKETPAVTAFLEERVAALTKPGSPAEVVWVLLDSVLLGQKSFESVWLPVARGAKIPFITGTEELASRQMNFATFAITPNAQDLAHQAVQQVEAILSDGVAPGELGIEDVISVNKILNLHRARELGLKIRESGLSEIKVIE